MESASSTGVPAKGMNTSSCLRSCKTASLTKTSGHSNASHDASWRVSFSLKIVHCSGNPLTGGSAYIVKRANHSANAVGISGSDLKPP